MSTKHGDYKEHGTPIKELLGQSGMRVIGRAYDLGIIKEEVDGENLPRNRPKEPNRNTRRAHNV